jgi:RimJ/RimL family protein N-acetyltransferase
MRSLVADSVDARAVARRRLSAFFDPPRHESTCGRSDRNDVMPLRPLDPPYDAAAIERLIRADAPARPRALAVLDGLLSGRAWADDPHHPSAAIVIEDSDGTVYAGGTLTADLVADALADVQTASGDLIFGFADPDDPMRGLVPGEPYWRGEAIDFWDREPPPDEADVLEATPADGGHVIQLDAESLPMTEWYADTLHAFGSIERWLELGIGFAVMVGDEMAGEATAGPMCRGLLEMGVVTREAYRRRGYGTLVSRLTARACEARGDRVWWNANAGNAPSIAIARRLGFRRERRYELVACRTAGA